MTVRDNERALLETMLSKLPVHASTVLGAEIKMDKIKAEEGWTPSDTDYVATLSVEKPTPLEIYISIDRASAIASGGLLVMMQPKVIKEKIARGDFSDDDADAMGECINQFTSVVNDSLRECISPDHHAVFVGGEVGFQPPEEQYLRGRAKLQVGDLHKGTIEFIVPRRLLDPSSIEDDADGRGVELSPEEMEALRDATREGFAAMGDKIVVFLPISRERDEWSSLLEQAGVEFEFAGDLLEMRRLCRAGEAATVVVDADACPSGGLPALARLHGWGDVSVPILVAASRPTRRHLVSCLAAGAASYVVKPLEGADVVRRLQEVREIWQDLGQPV